MPHRQQGLASDQSLLPKDLRPVNVVRTGAEDARIAVATDLNQGYFPCPVASPMCAETGGSPGSTIPVYYQAVADGGGGYVNIGYSNAMAAGGASGVGSSGWRVPVATPVGQAGMNPVVGYTFGPNLGNRVVGNAVDQASSDVGSGFVYNQNLGNRVVSGSSGGSAGSDQMANINDLAMGYGGVPNLAVRVSGSGIDQVSDEGGDDSVSGKKVKFLCSFGGKILPRPSDGVLRYVGGQTRIISLRREVSFNELVQKMMETYGQPVIIKYQLPDEDLDALVSVSCPDDLDNMMDEYEKLLERSLDGSAKLRVFLFWASELDPSGMVHLGDLHDSGQKYVEAVNGLMEGGGGSGSGVASGGITRKESIASATSTQNSDISGSDVIDSLCSGHGDIGMASSSSFISPKINSTGSHESAPRMVCVEPSPAAYTDGSGVSLGIPVVKSSAPQSSSSSLGDVESERLLPLTVQQQMGVDMHQARGDVPMSGTYVQTYMDPRQEVVNRADYHLQQLSPHMGYPNAQLLGHSSVLNTPQARDNTAGYTSHQYVPSVHVTMNHVSPQVGMRSTMVQTLMQPQTGRYSDESSFGTRVVQFPVDQTYNVYQSHAQPTLVGGNYGWQQYHQMPEHVVYSDGSMHHVIVPSQITKFEDCQMCQKALPHAHSDPLDPRDSTLSPGSDSGSVYHSLRPEDVSRLRLQNRLLVAGAYGEGIVDQGVATPQTRVFSHMDHQVGMPSTEATGIPQNTEMQRENVQQLQFAPQYQGKQPVNCDAVPLSGVAHVPSTERVIRESPREYSGILPAGVSKDDAANHGVSYEHQVPIEGKMETLRISPSEICANNEQNKSPVDKLRKDDNLDGRTQQMPGREVVLDYSVNGKPPIAPETNQIRMTEVVPRPDPDVSLLNNSRPMESYEVSPPMTCNAGTYLQSRVGTQHFDAGEVQYGKPAFSAAESVNLLDQFPNVADWRNDPLKSQPRFIDSVPEAVPPNVYAVPAASPGNIVGDVLDSSNSLFSNQDPWSLQQDVQVPPTRPNKVAPRMEPYLPRDPFDENQKTMDAARMEETIYQPSSNVNIDSKSEPTSSHKGSAEEQIKQELKVVAEGVAASVFQSCSSSKVEPSVQEKRDSGSESNQGREVHNSDIENQHKAKTEGLKNKIPEKAHFGFPVSDGIGCLQIIKNSDLEELQELGSGTFGTVYHGKWRGTDVAIKRINDRCFAGKPSEQERMIDDFWNEAKKLADLHHPNVVAFYGVVLDGPGGSVATVTEYMVNGSLRTALQKNERNLDKRKRLLIAMDVAFGMEYLHAKNIVHFDLKSDNLLVNLRDPHRPICKVGDLGLSKVKCQTLISGGVRGTLPWMAPELLNGSSSLVSEKVDVFSFGIVLWELLTGEEPYADLHYGAIIGGIVSNTLRPVVPESCDPEWTSLMERCWSAEPAERPTFTEIANELRSMTAKIPPKGHNPPAASAQPQVQK